MTIITTGHQLSMGNWSNSFAPVCAKQAHKLDHQIESPSNRLIQVKPDSSAIRMRIPITIIISIVIILQLITPNISGLESINQSITINNDTSASGSGGGGNEVASSSVASGSNSGNMNNNQYAGDEIAMLWKDLSVFSEKASSLISSDNKTTTATATTTALLAVKRPKNATFSLDSLASGRNSASNGQTNLLAEYEDGPPLDVIIANIVIFVIGFCGNSLVILVILKFTRSETVTDIYILNLAFADLMFIFGLIFLTITMYIGHWIFGTLMCKLHMACTSLNQFASSLLLVVMSFDRFLAVCHPIYAQRFRRLKRAKAICLCIWIACLILMIPIFSFARAEATAITDKLTCGIFWPEYKSFNCEIAFTLYSFAIGFAVPVLLIAVFYLCVIRKLRIAASGPLNLASSRRSECRANTNKRIEHLVIGIICTYTICWLPYWITQLCVSFTTLESSPIFGFYPLILIATCLSYTNSALNPILYAFLSDNFKRRCSDVFRSILSIKWCRRLANMDGPTGCSGGGGAGGGVGHSTIATAAYECASETNNCRPESRQTVIMNEAVRLVKTPNQLALDTLTTEINSNTSSDSHCINTNNINNKSNNSYKSNNNYNNSNSNNNSSSGGKGISNNNERVGRVDTVVSRRSTTLSGGGVSIDSTHCYINQDSYSSDKHTSDQDDISNQVVDFSGNYQNSEHFNDIDNYVNDSDSNSCSNICTNNNCLANANNHARRKSVAFSVGQVVAQGGTSVELLKGDQKTLLQHCQGAV